MVQQRHLTPHSSSEGSPVIRCCYGTMKPAGTCCLLVCQSTNHLSGVWRGGRGLMRGRVSQLLLISNGRSVQVFCRETLRPTSTADY